MELIVLGSSGAFPAAGGAASGYLLRQDGFDLWIDCGTGTLANLQRHVPYHSIDAILVSHEHPDHCLDLYPLFIARLFHPDHLDALPVHAPSGVFDRVGSLERDQEGGRMRDVFSFQTVEPGASFEIGPFSVRTTLLPHWVPNIGTRLEADGVAVAYTGDTGPAEGIVDIGRDADLLIAEASWQDAHRNDDEAQPYHLTSRGAAEHAARAEAKRLMLSHFWPGLDRDVSRAQAREAYGGDIVLAAEGVSVELGS
ncbi:MAG: MBL fold metallo-hydrolase [Actinomycetota bacterium]